jgi:hypothetical protein
LSICVATASAVLIGIAKPMIGRPLPEPPTVMPITWPFRFTAGSKLLAGSVLVALAAVLLLGPPVDTHLPHFIHHKVAHYVAPPAVSTSQP